jgi:taurine dioxygenase
MKWNTKRLTYKFGLEITGFDARTDASPESIARLSKLWEEHGVLLLRGQDLSPQELIDFSAKFGELDKHEALAPYRHPEYKEIYVVSTIPVNGKPSPTENLGRHWHSDLSYTLTPPRGSLFHCQVVPEVGGDTMFANVEAAYEGLSDGMKKLIHDLEVVHDFMATPVNKKKDPATAAELRGLNPLVIQPLVRVHPDTGKKSLYISEFFTTQIIGMTEKESAPILRMLFEHSIDPIYTYRHKYTKHDLVMWDNRNLIHVGVPDFDKKEPRHFLRTTVLGSPSGRPFAA